MSPNTLAPLPHRSRHVTELNFFASPEPIFSFRHRWYHIGVVRNSVVVDRARKCIIPIWSRTFFQCCQKEYKGFGRWANWLIMCWSHGFEKALACTSDGPFSLTLAIKISLASIAHIDSELLMARLIITITLASMAACRSITLTPLFFIG